MLKRYVHTRDFLPQLKSDDIARLALTPSENRRADRIVQQLEPLESVNKILQHDCTTVSDVQTLFDPVISKYSDTTNRLSVHECMLIALF